MPVHFASRYPSSPTILGPGLQLSSEKTPVGWVMYGMILRGHVGIIRDYNKQSIRISLNNQYIMERKSLFISVAQLREERNVLDI